MGKAVSLGDLQLAIMRELWRCKEATVLDVHAALEKARGLAPTTIATMLKKMEQKGVVKHREEGRRFVYRPTVSEEVVTRSMVAELTRRLFDGDAGALVSHLLTEKQIEPNELGALKKQVAVARRRADKDGK